MVCVFIDNKLFRVIHHSFNWVPGFVLVFLFLYWPCFFILLPLLNEIGNVNNILVISNLKALYTLSLYWALFGKFEFACKFSNKSFANQRMFIDFHALNNDMYANALKLWIVHWDQFYDAMHYPMAKQIVLFKISFIT